MLGASGRQRSRQTENGDRKKVDSKTKTAEKWIQNLY